MESNTKHERATSQDARGGIHAFSLSSRRKASPRARFFELGGGAHLQTNRKMRALEGFIYLLPLSLETERRRIRASGRTRLGSDRQRSREPDPRTRAECDRRPWCARAGGKGSGAVPLRARDPGPESHPPARSAPRCPSRDRIARSRLGRRFPRCLAPGRSLARARSPLILRSAPKRPDERPARVSSRRGRLASQACSLARAPALVRARAFSPPLARARSEALSPPSADPAILLPAPARLESSRSAAGKPSKSRRRPS